MNHVDIYRFKDERIHDGKDFQIRALNNTIRMLENQLNQKEMEIKRLNEQIDNLYIGLNFIYDDKKY